MSKNSIKSLIKCPHCGGKNVYIRERIEYSEVYLVENNKLYKSDKEIIGRTGVMWLSCLVCLQDEEIEISDWQPTKEEAKRIREMLSEPRLADVTEYMDMTGLVI